MGEIDPAGERSAEGADGPIASPNETIPAEAGDNMVEPRTERGGIELGGVSVGDETAQLAMDMRELRETSEVVGPRIEGV